MAFYARLFQQTAKMDWNKVRELGIQFETVVRRKWPAYLEEMQGRNC